MLEMIKNRKQEAKYDESHYKREKLKHLESIIMQ